MRKYSVVVIGGGSSGLFTAYYLVKQGVRDVAVFEERYLGYGGTMRCAGGIRASFTSEVHAVLMKKSIEEWVKLGREHELIDFRQGGYVWLLTNEDLVKQHERLMNLHNSLGIPTKMVYGDEVREVVPGIELRDVIAALHDPIAGKSSPLQTLYGLRKAVVSAGAEVFTYTPVESLVIKSGRVVGIRVGGAELTADYVVITAGYKTAYFLGELGYELPIKKDPHHLLITEKVKYFLDPLVIHKESGSYVVQMTSGGIIIGTEYPVPEGDLRLRLGFLRKAVGIMSRYFPQLLSANLLRVWTGYYLKTPDHHPVVGPLPEHDNVLIATGFSGHGYMMGPVVGRELANYIVRGEFEFKATSKLSITRFERGELLEEAAVFG